MRVLLDKTGKGQLEVLSVLAEHGELRHKEIVENSTVSKGAVSNNVEKLAERSLVNKDEEISLNSDRLLQLYREHIEAFLVRDSSEPDSLNNTRTYVKKNISEILESDSISDILNSVLAEAGERQDLESLNSVFKETDRILRETAEKPEVKLIALSTDKSNTVTDNPKIAEEAEKILNEVK